VQRPRTTWVKTNVIKHIHKNQNHDAYKHEQNKYMCLRPWHYSSFTRKKKVIAGRLQKKVKNKVVLGNCKSK